MKLTLRCPRCDYEVQFQPEDRGFEVYCQSCGRACKVPEEAAGSDPAGQAAAPASIGAEPEAAGRLQVAYQHTASVAPREPCQPPTARPPLRVFSPAALAQIRQHTVRQVVCGCGRRIPVTLDQLDSTIYCPSCGASVPVADSLQTAWATTSHAPEEESAQPSSLPVSKPRAWWRPRSPVGLLAMAIVAASLASGAYVTWANSAAVRKSVMSWIVLKNATALPGGNSVRQQTKAAETDPKRQQSAPELGITLQAIEQLLRRPDVRAALVDAQIWQQELADFGVPDSDRRRVRLAEVIDVLTRKLIPPPPKPPAFVTRFRQLLGTMAKQLIAGRLSAARAAQQEAEKLLQAHPQQLAPFMKRYATLKEKLRQAEREAQGFKNIERLLQRAAELATEGKVTEALEAEAQAKFLAPRTPLTDAQHQQLDQQARQLAPLLKLARGKRALEDAQQCLQAGDPQARDRQVENASSLLQQGLPEREVRPLLVKLREIAKQSISNPRRSAMGRELQVRDAYESLLVLFSRARTPRQAQQLVEKCMEVYALLPDQDRRNHPFAKKLGALALDALEPHVATLLDQPLSEPQLLDDFRAARKAINRLQPWQHLTRWKTLDAAVQQGANELAHHTLQQAAELAQQDKLKDAIAKIRLAQELGTTEVRRKADSLRAQWETELKLRASLAAQKKQWNRIQQLRKEDKLFEAWQQLQLFRRRFPDSPHNRRVQRLQDELRPIVQGKLDEMFKNLETHWESEDWPTFRRKLELIQSVPLPEQYEKRLEQWRNEIKQLQQRADTLFLQAQRYKHMASRHAVMKLLEMLPAVLRLNPNHQQARQLLQEAKKRGTMYAKGLLRSAENLRKWGLNAKYRQRLQEVSRLDPEGESGKRARELLQKLAEPKRRPT